MCSVMGVVFVDVFSSSCIMSIGFLLQYRDPYVAGCSSSVLGASVPWLHDLGVVHMWMGSCFL